MFCSDDIRRLLQIQPTATTRRPAVQVCHGRPLGNTLVRRLRHLLLQEALSLSAAVGG